MNKFELYCMIFYVLDAAWDEFKNDSLGNFLSDANPFLFSDIGSADPSVYVDFCEKVTDPIDVETSFAKAQDYVQKLSNQYVSNAFSSITENEWVECVRDYLSKPHKGQSV